MVKIKQQLLKNSASTILQMIAAFISGLILPPLLIAKLGFETYGVWGLVVLLNQYTLLLDLGFQTGCIKLTSEFISQNDEQRVNKIFSTTIFVYGLLILIISLALILFNNYAFNSFFGDKELYPNLISIAMLYSFASLFNLLTLPFSNLLKGFHRHDIFNFIETVSLIINAVLSIVMILMN